MPAFVLPVVGAANVCREVQHMTLSLAAAGQGHLTVVLVVLVMAAALAVAGSAMQDYGCLPVFGAAVCWQVQVLMLTAPLAAGQGHAHAYAHVTETVLHGSSNGGGTVGHAAFRRVWLFFLYSSVLGVKVVNKCLVAVHLQARSMCVVVVRINL